MYNTVSGGRGKGTFLEFLRTSENSLLDSVSAGEIILAPLFGAITLSESISAGDILSGQVVAVLIDSASVSDIVSSTLELAITLNESIAVDDSINAILVAPLADSVPVGEATLTISLVELSDSIPAGDSASSLVETKVIFLDSIASGDSLGASIATIIVDSVSAGDAIASNILAIGPLIDSTPAGDTLASSITVYAKLTDLISVSDTISQVLTLVGVLSDSIIAGDTLAREATLVTVVNAETGAVSTYHFSPTVRGMVEFKGILYLACDDGLYAVDASQDDTGDIVWSVKTGTMDFGTDQLKRIRDINAQMRTLGTTDLIVTTAREGVKRSDRYSMVPKTQTSYRDGIIKVGAGLSSVYWGLELTGTGPAEIDQLKVAVMPLGRRR